MKKIKYNFFAITIFVICFFSFVLTGCGATPMNKVQSVRFVSEKYEMIEIVEEGVSKQVRHAVFEADLNQEIELKVKLTPSSWSGYHIAVKDFNNCQGENASRFSRNNLKMTIEKENYVSASFRVGLDDNNYDYCIVHLKKYPTAIGFLNLTRDGFIENPVIYLSIGGSVRLSPYGLFGEDFIQLTEQQYNYEITSSDQTTVKVENSKMFTISAVRQTVGKAKIKFKLKDLANIDKFEFDIDVFVIENADASNSFTYLEKTDIFLTNNSTIEVEKSGLEVDDDYYLIKYNNYQFSSEGFLVLNDQSLLYCDSQYVVIDNDNKVIKIDNRFLAGELIFNVWCQSKEGVNNFYTFKIRVI